MLATPFRFIVHTSLGDLILYVLVGLLLLWFMAAIFWHWLRSKLDV